MNSIQSPYCWCVGGISGLTQLSIRQTGEGLTSEGINTQVIKLKEQGCTGAQQASSSSKDQSPVPPALGFFSIRRKSPLSVYT